MEGSSLLLGYSCSSSSPPSILKPQFEFTSLPISSSFLAKYRALTSLPKCNGWPKSTLLVVSCPRSRTTSLRTSAFAVQQEALGKSKDSFSTPTTPSSSRDMLPKIDKSGRFCSPRAAREFAL